MRRQLLIITLLLTSLQGWAVTYDPYRHIGMEDGLLSNAVRNIVQDKYGYLWFGTDNGLCRYDGIKVHPYRIAENNSNQYISALLPLDEGILAGTERGVFLLSFGTDRFERLPIDIHSTVTYLSLDKESNLWISTSEQGVWRYTFHNKETFHYDFTPSNGFVSQVYIDNANQVWAVTNWAVNPINRLNRLHNQFEPVSFKHEKPYNSLRMLQSRDGRQWLGTWEQGLMLIHNDGQLEQVLAPGVANHIHTLFERADNTILIGCDDGLICFNPANRLWQQLSPSDRFVYAITSDTEGGLWIGTFYGGVYYMSPMGRRFEGFTTADGLRGNVISRFCEDQQGNVWIASDDGGIMCYSPEQRRFIDYAHQDELSTVNAHALALKGAELWIGTYTRGVYVLNVTNGQLRHYGQSSLTDPSSYAIFHDSQGRTWVATMEGFNLYLPESDSFQRIGATDALTIDIDEDAHHRLWLTTQGAGLWCYSPDTKEMKHYRYQADEEYSLPSDQVNCTLIDAGGRLWIGTFNGLCYYDETKDQFLSVELGVETGNVMTIIEDQGVLWLSTEHGIVKYEPSQTAETTQRFTRHDGLVSEQFQPNAGIKASNGRIYFGAVNGFNAFFPYQIKVNRIMPPVYVEAQEVHNQMIFSFVALSYCSPEKNQYAYMLEGYDKDWNYVGSQTRATYTNLPAGNYTFRVKATNNDGIWSDKEASVSIVVPPPFWWTWYAKLFYILLLMFCVWYYIRFRLKQAEKRHQQELQQLQEQQEKEAREARLNFFTMVAHEIRTPVSLIIGPLEKIKNESEELRIINRNAHRLLELVNQLLDFRKVEQQSLVMHFAPYNIYDLLHSVCERFVPTFQQNGMLFTVNYPNEHFTAIVDAEALTKVISNLLSNANKYSKSKITLTCMEASDKAHFRIVVSDDGAGIREEDRSRIFEPFFQAQNNKPGTGIGLNIVKSIVDLHHGSITVDSEVGQGATFTITLPVQQTKKENVETKNGQSLLIVDDSDDMLEFLSSSFNQQYQIVTAHDGIEALNRLSKQQFDLIISDWMMPRMDGAAFCKQIRSNTLTSHIPFIMLTAKTDDQSKVEGMDVGADAYIEKPFSLKYLDACIRNMIERRRSLMKRFAEVPEEPIAPLANNALDNEFLQRMNSIIEANVSNTDFNVNMLAEEMNVSRSGLFAKIKAITDVTPNEMIQVVRLKRAAQLLAEGRYRINEVCYMVGFSSPSYFTKCFSKQFGKKPGEMMSGTKGH